VLLGIECVLANDKTLSFLFSVAEPKRSLRSTHYKQRIILLLQMGIEYVPLLSLIMICFKGINANV
jgi:hypothetical protein